MVLLVVALASLVGLLLGLLGGGGSILTLPLLTYVADLEPRSAIASSLLVVATTSALSALGHARAGRVRWRTALHVGGAGMLGSFLGGRLAAFLPGKLLMLLFAVLMVATAVAMLRPRRPAPAAPAQEVAAPRELTSAHALALGGGVGVLTGLLGAGGGFLIVPALVLLGGLRMPEAVGTSLAVIAMSSFAGLAARLDHVELEWRLTLMVTAAAVLGSFAGSALAGRISERALRQGFGVLVMVMAVLVLGKELW